MDFDFNMFHDIAEDRQRNTGVVAEFYDKQIKTNEINDKGFPVFKTKLYVRIRTTDNPDIYDQPASQDNISRFPVEYNRYLISKKEIENGTPLNQFAFLTVEQIEDCRHRGIFTVERLAELTEEQARALQLDIERAAAVRFVAISKNNAVIAEFNKKEEAYKAQIKALQEKIDYLMAAKKEVKED